jgi:hypothetical protein
MVFADLTKKAAVDRDRSGCPASTSDTWVALGLRDLNVALVVALAASPRLAPSAAVAEFKKNGIRRSGPGNGMLPSGAAKRRAVCWAVILM